MIVLSKGLLCSVLQRMLRRNPLAALSLNRPSSASAADHLSPEQKDCLGGGTDDSTEDAASQLIATRGGQVLGPYSILKEDHFPGPTLSSTHLTSCV